MRAFHKVLEKEVTSLETLEILRSSIDHIDVENTVYVRKTTFEEQVVKLIQAEKSITLIEKTASDEAASLKLSKFWEMHKAQGF